MSRIANARSRNPAIGIATPWRGVITDRYTYARYENAPWVLFDNRADPWQMTNLATDPVHARLSAELDAKPAALMTEKRDAWSCNSSELVEEGARLYGEKTFHTIAEYLAGAGTNGDPAAKTARP